MSAELRRPQRQSLTQQCAGSMKDYIATRALQPGDRLPTEQEWAEMLGVSRLVVREALHALAAMGMVDIQQGRGTFVRDSAEISVYDQVTFGLDLAHLSYVDVLEARAMLDLAVLELCILRADEQDIAELNRLLTQMEAEDAAGRDSKPAHREFHYRMLRAARNPLIERVGTMLIDAFWRMGDSIPGLVYLPNEPIGARFIESHRALVEAIRTRDLSQSRRLVVEHLPFQPGVHYVFPTVSQPGPAGNGAGQ